MLTSHEPYLFACLVPWIPVAASSCSQTASGEIDIEALSDGTEEVTDASDDESAMQDFGDEIGEVVGDSSGVEAGADERTTAEVGAAEITLVSNRYRITAGFVPDTGSPTDFGHAVAVSGTTVVVGGVVDDNYVGSVHVFERGASGWAKIQKIEPNPRTEWSWFGDSVAIDDGTMVIGAVGAVHVFARAEGAWREETVLGSGGTSEYPGLKVAVSGLRILASDPGNEGRMVVYERNVGGWKEATLPGCASESAIRGDVVVAANASLGASACDSMAGVRVINHIGDNWREGVFLRVEGVTLVDDVALSGQFAVVGSQAWTLPIRGMPQSNPGLVQIFQSTFMWKEVGRFGQDEAYGALTGFGYSVAATDDMVVVGVRGYVGVVLVFERTQDWDWVERARLDVHWPDPYGTEGIAVAAAPGVVIVGTYPTCVNGPPCLPGIAVVLEPRP